MKTITLIFILLLSLFTINSKAQCIVTSDFFDTHNTFNFGTVEEISDIAYTGDFIRVAGLIVGNDYEFTIVQAVSTTHKYITVTDESNTVIAHGPSPLTVNAITVDQIRLHYTENAACDENFGISHTVTIQCISASCTLPDLLNDECSDAIDLDTFFNTDDTCTIVYSGNNIGATNSASEVAPSMECVDSDAAPKDIWYSLTVPSNGMFSYTYQSSPGISSIVEVYTGTCGNLTALTPVNCTSAFAQKEFVGLTPGSTVYMRWWDFNSDDEGALSFCIKDNSTLSINEYNFEGLSIYPNPVENNLELSALRNIENVSIYNLLGQEVLIAKPNLQESSIDMSTLKEGSYFVKVTINGATETFKILKR